MTESKRKISSLAPYKVKNNTVFIFLQKREKNASRCPGFFGFFGGGMENNETPEETLLREIKEELNLTLTEFDHFNTYDLPEIAMDLFVTKVDDDFEDKITILEGEYGKWFSEEEFRKERNFITGDLEILEELYNKLQLKERLKNIKGVVFDIDGLLLDTEWYQWQGWVPFLRKHGVELTKELYLSYAGKRGDIIEDEMVKDFN